VLNHRSFEFWLGRAGSGKSHACIEAIAKQAHDQPRGRPLMLLVPEQMSAQADYRLIAQSGLMGSTRARVITFESLRREVFEKMGGRPQRVIDAEGRVLLLRQLIRTRRGDLRILGNCVDLPGLAETVSASLHEFQSFGWTLANMNARIARIESERTQGAADTLFEWKLRDVALLWTDYELALKERELSDEFSIDEIAAAKLKACEDLWGSKIWIDGFGFFNARERMLLESLLEHAEAAALALLVDPRDSRFVALREGEAQKVFPRTGNERGFETIEQTYVTFRARLTELGWISKDVEFPTADQPTRFSHSRVLHHLESRVLKQLAPQVCPGEIWDESASASEEAFRGAPIELLELPDRRAEVEAIARRIAAMHTLAEDGPPPAGPGPRWADATVITRDLEAYAPLVREIFPRYGIPFFIDERRSISSHPLARLLISALTIVAHGPAIAPILDYLKSHLSPMQDADAIARIENLARERRLVAQDWFAFDRWSADSRGARAASHEAASDPGVAKLFEEWRTSAQPIFQLQSELNKDRIDPALALWNFLSRLQVARRLQEWTDAARASGDQEVAMVHEEAWKEIVELLERLHTIGTTKQNPSEPIDYQELIETVEAGLASIRAGLIPPTLDQVLIGQVDRTRTPEVKAAFVVGMSDGEFPRFHQEDPIFGDQERRRLNSDGRELGPDSKSKFDEERAFAYIALTRASEYLIVSRPTASGADKPGGPSSYFRAVREAFPLASVESKSPSEVSAMKLPEEWAGEIAQAYYAAAKGNNPAGLGLALAGAHPLCHPNFQARQNETARNGVATIFAAMNPARTARIDSGLAMEFWHEDRQLSITSLESYIRCPFQFFGSRMLRLERPREALPGPQELGSLRHKILEILFKRLGDGGPVHWGAINPKEAERIVEDAAQRVMEEELVEGFGRDPLTRAMAGVVEKEMKYFVRALHAMGRRYQFAQTSGEYRFGGQDQPAVELPAGNDFSFVLHGSIDRVDELNLTDARKPAQLLLYDYKSTAKKMDYSRAVEGMILQLPAYAWVLNETYGRQDKAGKGNPSASVVGFFYWPLSIGMAPAEGEDERWAEPGTEAWFKNHQLDGLFASSVAPELDTEAGMMGALAFKFKFTKGGELHKGLGNWLSDRGFQAFIDHTRELMKKNAEAIAKGKIGVEPFQQRKEKACGMCDFESICRIG